MTFVGTPEDDLEAGVEPAKDGNAFEAFRNAWNCMVCGAIHGPEDLACSCVRDSEAPTHDAALLERELAAFARMTPGQIVARHMQCAASPEILGPKQAVEIAGAACARIRASRKGGSR